MYIVFAVVSKPAAQLAEHLTYTVALEPVLEINAHQLRLRLAARDRGIYGGGNAYHKAVLRLTGIDDGADGDVYIVKIAVENLIGEHDARVGHGCVDPGI